MAKIADGEVRSLDIWSWKPQATAQPTAEQPWPWLSPSLDSWLVFSLGFFIWNLKYPVERGLKENNHVWIIWLFSFQDKQQIWNHSSEGWRRSPIVFDLKYESGDETRQIIKTKLGREWKGQKMGPEAHLSFQTGWRWRKGNNNNNNNDDNNNNDSISDNNDDRRTNSINDNIRNNIDNDIDNNNDLIRNNNNEDESMYVKKNKFPRNFWSRDLLEFKAKS